MFSVCGCREEIMGYEEFKNLELKTQVEKYLRFWEQVKTKPSDKYLNILFENNEHGELLDYVEIKLNNSEDIFPIIWLLSDYTMKYELQHEALMITLKQLFIDVNNEFHRNMIGKILCRIFLDEESRQKVEEQMSNIENSIEQGNKYISNKDKVDTILIDQNRYLKEIALKEYLQDY